MRFSGFLLNATLLLGAMSLSAQVQHSLSFNLAEFSFSNDTIGVTPYCKVDYQGLLGGGDVATPELPIKYVTFAVPTLCHDITVTAITSGETVTTLSLPLFPVQEPKSVNDTTETYTLPDETIYNTDAFYPQIIASVVDEGYFDGNKHMVTVAVYPSQYNPVTGKLKSFSTINLTVNYSSGLSDNPTLVPISRNLDAPDIIYTVKSFVANPSQVEQFATHTGSIMPLSTYSAEDSLPGYEYCIITSRELAPAFKRLVHFKRQKGIDAGIVCMEDILESSLYQDGDLVSGINDDAGKLRQYLKDAWQYNNTKYVLLGGKPPHVPIRYACIGSDTTNMNNLAPTDVYFGDLNGNWDANKNGRYGQISDQIDYFLDVYVGRLLCKNQEEVNNYIDKLLIYELNPGNGDYSYLNRVFVSTSHSLNYCESYISPTLKSIFSEYSAIFQDGCGPTGAEVINLLNSNKAGIYSPIAHGNPGSFTLSDKDVNGTNNPKLCNRRYGINPVDDMVDLCGMTEENNNGFDNLNNKYYPSVLYTFSCTTMPYDIYTERGTYYNTETGKRDTTYRTYDIPMNLGESYTLGKDYGGVAYLGNTRLGWTSQAKTLQNSFFRCLKNGITNVGIAEALSRTSKESASLFNSEKLQHNLLGDPEFMIWCDSVKLFNNISALRSANSISVSGYDLDSCVVAIYGTDGSVKKQIITGDIATISDVSPNSSLMLYRKNTIPFFAPIAIQNTIINSSVSFRTSTASLGNSIDVNRLPGDVIFDNGADFTIYASDDVLIDSGVIVKSGATLTIESKGKVTIAGGTVEVGGVLNIKAVECDMSHDFNTKKGATVNFHKIN